MKIYYLKRIRKRFSWIFNRNKEHYVLIDRNLQKLIEMTEGFYNEYMKSKSLNRTFQKDLVNYFESNPPDVFTKEHENEFLFQFMKGLIFHTLWTDKFGGIAAFNQKVRFHMIERISKRKPMGTARKGKGDSEPPPQIHKIRLLGESPPE